MHSVDRSQAFDEFLEIARKDREQCEAHEKQRKESENVELLAAAYWGIVPQVLEITHLVKRDDLIQKGQIEEHTTLTKVCAEWMSDCRRVGADIHAKGGCSLMYWAVEKFVPRDQHCVFDAGFEGVGNDADRWGH